MKNLSAEFDIATVLKDDMIEMSASGEYSLVKANHLFKTAIDNVLFHLRSKILIDVKGVTGHIPFSDRFQFADSLSKYRETHALGKVGKIAVVGKEPIVDKDRFGETVAINRGTNVRVFTDMSEALRWINEE
jgi:hypothetical protein